MLDCCLDHVTCLNHFQNGLVCWLRCSSPICTEIFRYRGDFPGLLNDIFKGQQAFGFNWLPYVHLIRTKLLLSFLSSYLRKIFDEKHLNYC